MSDSAIIINNLGKKYTRSVPVFQSKQKAGNDFWALRNIDFEIKKGEIFGIIGANGAGKSTLLKLLSKVSQPTEGNFKIEGRINALLELGTGFHPELNGYDNIFMGCALHGIPRQEVVKKLDSIIEFAGIGAAINYQLRTYSTGMYVRLAFSVAIHTRPDILLLDEILAVGDEQFQRKCFEAIRDHQRNGVTIVLVSHELKLITLLCQRVLLLNNGRMLKLGKASDVVETFTKLKGCSISSNNLSINHSNMFTHLWWDKHCLTGKFGVYTSVRSRGIWYDPSFVQWEHQQNQQNQLVIQGKYMNIPLFQKWFFSPANENGFEWKIYFHVLEEFQLDRIQVNIMLSEFFNEWFAGSETNSFPEHFDNSTGEDWSRIWIGSPDTFIGCRSQSGKWSGAISLTVTNTDGSLLVVNSSAMFKSRVLQYLDPNPNAEDYIEGEKLFFRGTVSAKKN